MIMRLALLLLAVFVLTAVGCSGGPPKRVFPPDLSVQELRLGPGGQWTARLRVRSFSTVPMQIENISGEITLGSTPSVTIALQPALDIAAGSVEVVELPFTASAELQAAVSAVQTDRGVLKYQLRGEISSSEPRRRFEFEFSSALSPVPGLSDVLR